MRLTEAEYKKLCEKRGFKYEPPAKKEKKINEVKNEAVKSIWEDRRRRRSTASIGTKETLVISGRFPGLNEIVQEAKKHHNAYAQMKFHNSSLVTFAALDQIKYNYNYVDVHILWVEPNKKRDKDNITAGSKFILDGIVNAAVLTGDGWREIKSITNSFDVDEDNPRIEVTIIEAGKDKR